MWGGLARGALDREQKGGEGVGVEKGYRGRPGAGSPVGSGGVLMVTFCHHRGSPTAIRPSGTRGPRKDATWQGEQEGPWGASKQHQGDELEAFYAAPA